MRNVSFIIAAIFYAHICLADENYNHGPRAGYMRDQGDLLSELVPLRSKEGFSFYLLNNTWVDVSLEKYSMKAALHPKGSKAGSPINCSNEKNTFKCTYSKGKMPAEGDVIIISVTDEKKALREYSYKFPFTHKGTDK